jgi:alpha-aminoadipate carrier protein LysW
VPTTTTCPACDSELSIPEDVRPSEILDCASCASELEVLVVAPLMLGLAPETEEDWGE